MLPALLDNVTHRYGPVTALDRASLEVRRGEVLALLGPNGAGKTTAVQNLLGLRRPASGRSGVFGRAPDSLEARRRCGVMLQVSGVPATLRVAEHIDLFRSYYDNPLPACRVIQLAGLEGLEHRLAGRLSGGQRQRLMFALALCGNPELLFLDEPTAGLDVSARRGLWNTIRELSAEGRTILLTTHYLEEADALADRVVVLNHGRVVAEGAPSRIKSRVASSRVRCRTALSSRTIADWHGVQHVRAEGASLEVLCTNAEEIVRRLLSEDPGLTGLEVTGASLEEAFLELTEDSHTKAA
jgi:ABC-2 type transport system ATP-binding protein